MLNIAFSERISDICCLLVDNISIIKSVETTIKILSSVIRRTVIVVTLLLHSKLTLKTKICPLIRLSKRISN
jgi:hypothetical protein